MKELNHKEIKKDPQGITKTIPFINRYNRKKVNFSSEKDGWKKIEKNNVTIAFHTLHAKKEKYNLPMLLNITQVVRNKMYFNDSKWG